MIPYDVFYLTSSQYRIEWLELPGVVLPGMEGGVVVGEVVPVAVEVVGHDVDEVEVAGDALHVVPLVHPAPAQQNNKLTHNPQYYIKYILNIY